LCAWTESTTGNGRIEIGSAQYFVQASSAGPLYVTRNWSGSESSAPVNSGVGNFLHSRSSASGYDRYANGAAQTAGAMSSAAVDGTELFVAARNAGAGVPDNFSLKRLALFDSTLGRGRPICP
jgi:hypothetical protein